MYPHQICFDPSHASFWPLATLGGIFTLFLITGYPFFLFCLKRRLSELPDRQRCSAKEEEEEVPPASWWTFVFDDFRPDCRYFALVVVGKDILLNLIIVVLPGQGTFQLLVTAMVSSGYAFQVQATMPFHDNSNTLLEACTSVAVSILCVFSAGMGFQSEPEVLNLSAYLKDGRHNPVYVQRAITLVCLQTLSLFGPASIISFQALAAFERTRRCLPRALLPATAEQLQDWRVGAHAALDQLDDVALASVRRVMVSSPAAQRSLRQASSSFKTDGPESTNEEQPEFHPVQPNQPTDEPQVEAPKEFSESFLLGSWSL